ncbi:hypothetical protein NPIL_481901 [Nephila pilipes]|uniref:Uncharacterized protein n=1 Tax=Nephila pilipes TaxID=299642 RepID=A0A8X6PC89_NEPPI|nr:hypothetical protein NPIL_481901 [Nephila pilipes]
MHLCSASDTRKGPELQQSMMARDVTSTPTQKSCSTVAIDNDSRKNSSGTAEKSYNKLQESTNYQTSFIYKEYILKPPACI